MAADERRAQLEGAAVEVLRRSGMAATTKEIAAEAVVAEGTIFRVFDTKDDLIHAALARAFNPLPLVTALRQIDTDQPLRARLLAMVSTHQRHLMGLFELMAAIGMVRPPDSLHQHGHQGHAEAQAQVQHQMLALVEPDVERLSVPPAHLVRLLRMVTFAGSHQHIAHGDLLTPQQIVDVLLDGTLLPEAMTPEMKRANAC